MKNQALFNELKSLKQVLQKDGFIIDGVFGSYARDENTEQSDVDILYHLEEQLCIFRFRVVICTTFCINVSYLLVISAL